ncbi:MAG: aspartate--tRNA ligase [Ignavibacteria bacterium]|nr:aspartate--tRNA ligase [Ignavibacteria bacterium]
MSFNTRTHTCGELKLSNVNEVVTLNGWVAKKRDLGGLLFIDLRDRYGVTQIKIAPEQKDIYEVASKVGNEFVISVGGVVIERESKNKNIPTGEIEIDVQKFQILNEASVTPFVIEDEVKASEDLRLQYRYLDLRRHSLQRNLMIRSDVYRIVRNFYADRNFVEVETPILMKSTPEGARDYLVPSRVHKGKFYALPQSPQTYKQILMVSGLDRYIQICKCFRDEDLRADRQPEFTQIDLEMSFVHQQDVFNMTEPMFKEIWKEILGIELQTPFPQMSYDFVLENYGSDKPDLRIFGLSKIVNISEIVKDSEFVVFKNALAEKNGIVAGVKFSFAENKIDVTRKIIDGLTDFVKKLGFGGLGYIKYNLDGSVQSPLQKFLNEEVQANIKNTYEAKDGEIIFILSGAKKKVLTSLGTIRNKIAADYKLIDKSKYEFLWVTDFPLFHYDEESGEIAAEHHMFTSPKAVEMHKFDEAKNLSGKERGELLQSIKADCYDLVLNGNEIASGSIRIHRQDIQKKVFDVVGLTEQEQQEKFGFLLNAFQYGAPPHGGVAFGFDRIVAILCGLDAIRDVIAFPKTVSAASLMDESPSNVAQQQLDDLGISIFKQSKNSD